MLANTNTRLTNKQYCKEEPISTDRSFFDQEYDCSEGRSQEAGITQTFQNGLEMGDGE